MANHASYSKIGFAVVAGVAAIVATLIYIGGMSSGKDVVFAETYSDSPVSGLSVGSDVNFRGVKVGEVRYISFVGSEYGEATEGDVAKIHILIAFTTKKMRRNDDEDPEDHLRDLVRRGLRATVTSSGVTGLSRIELNFPRTAQETAKISWHPRNVCIPPAPSMLESFSEAATKFISQLNRMDFVTAWSNISSVAESAAKIAGNVEDLVSSGKSGVESIVRDIEDAASKVRELTSELKENPSLLIRPSDPDPLPETAK